MVCLVNLELLLITGMLYKLPEWTTLGNYVSIYLSICLSVCLSIYLSMYLCIYLSIYLSNINRLAN